MSIPRVSIHTALAVAVSLLLSFGLLLCVPFAPLTRDHPNFRTHGDHTHYLAVAESPLLDYHVAPFCWRVGVPWLVKALPATPEIAFFTIAFVSLWLIGPGLYILMRSLGHSVSLSFLSIPLFYSLWHAVGFNLYDFWLSDPAAFLLVVLIFIAAAERRAIAFATLLTFGILVKESVIFTVPLWYTLGARRPVERNLALQTALYTLPAMVALLVIRALIPPLNGDVAYLSTLPEYVRGNPNIDHPYRYFATLQSVLVRRAMRNTPVELLYRITLGAFGLPLLLTLFAEREWWLRFAPFLALVLAQLLFAYDTERLVVLAFPAVIALELSGFKRLWSFAVSRYRFRSSSGHI